MYTHSPRASHAGAAEHPAVAAAELVPAELDELVGREVGRQRLQQGASDERHADDFRQVQPNEPQASGTRPVIPPSSIPPRAPLTPPAVPTPSATLTPRATPTPSVAASGRALKSCDALKAEIQAKLDAKSLTGYALTIMTSGDLQGPHVVGSCEGNTKKIVLNRSRNAP